MSTTTLSHRYSFSGSDTKAYAYYSSGNLLKLESMHTLSCSVFEAKGRVRSLGFKSIRGFSRAVREISGTMIMLVIEGHPLRPLMEANPYHKSNYYGESKRSWSIDARETARGSSSSYQYGPGQYEFTERESTRIPTTLPPFNILVEFVSEIPVGSDSRTLAGRNAEPVHQKGAFELIDIEIMGEGIVTSVNDMVTEVQYQFVARDYKEYSLNIPSEIIRKYEQKAFDNDANSNVLPEGEKIKLQRSLKNNENVELNITDGEIKVTTSVGGESNASGKLLSGGSSFELEDPVNELLTEDGSSVSGNKATGLSPEQLAEIEEEEAMAKEQQRLEQEEEDIEAYIMAVEASEEDWKNREQNAIARNAERESKLSESTDKIYGLEASLGESAYILEAAEEAYEIQLYEAEEAEKNGDLFDFSDSVLEAKKDIEEAKKDVERIEKELDAERENKKRLESGNSRWGTSGINVHEPDGNEWVDPWYKEVDGEFQESYDLVSNGEQSRLTKVEQDHPWSGLKIPGTNRDISYYKIESFQGSPSVSIYTKSSLIPETYSLDDVSGNLTYSEVYRKITQISDYE